MTAFAASAPVVTVRPGICHVPDCGEPARLYPAGWLCEKHKPGSQPDTTRSTP